MVREPSQGPQAAKTPYIRIHLEQVSVPAAQNIPQHQLPPQLPPQLPHQLPLLLPRQLPRQLPPQPQPQLQAQAQTSAAQAPSGRPKRQTEQERRSDEQKRLFSHLARDDDLCPPLKLQVIPGKGRGVFTTTPYKKHDFVVEYVGELISKAEAEERDIRRAEANEKSFYMYHFRFNNKNLAIDATREVPNRYGRVVNHGKKKANLNTKLVSYHGEPRLYLVAARDIAPGEELLFDYGDTSQSSREDFPWLKE